MDIVTHELRGWIREGDLRARRIAIPPPPLRPLKVKTINIFPQVEVKFLVIMLT